MNLVTLNAMGVPILDPLKDTQAGVVMVGVVMVGVVMDPVGNPHGKGVQCCVSKDWSKSLYLNKIALFYQKVSKAIWLNKSV